MQQKYLCTASRQNGQPCKSPAIRGGNVCRMHGGAAPQVKRKAEERLAMLVDPAIGVLAASMRQKKDKRIALAAATDVLDRNNLSGKQQVELVGQGWADILRERRARREPKPE